MNGALNDAILELRGVTKSFATHTAVSAVNLAIPRGSFFSLLGPSGCGKSTTLRMIAGFETPDVGEIHLNGARASTDSRPTAATSTPSSRITLSSRI